LELVLRPGPGVPPINENRPCPHGAILKVVATGQTPTMQYNRALREAILHDRVPIARNVNAPVIPLDDAPEGYQEFDAGAPKKCLDLLRGVAVRQVLTRAALEMAGQRPDQALLRPGDDRRSRAPRAGPGEVGRRRGTTHRNSVGRAEGTLRGLRATARARRAAG
jgi:hypothetical protein